MPIAPMKATTAKLEVHAAPRTWKSLRLVPSTKTGDLSAGLSLTWGERISAPLPVRRTTSCYRSVFGDSESRGPLEPQAPRRLARSGAQTLDQPAQGSSR